MIKLTVSKELKNFFKGGTVTLRGDHFVKYLGENEEMVFRLQEVEKKIYYIDFEKTIGSLINLVENGSELALRVIEDSNEIQRSNGMVTHKLTVKIKNKKGKMIFNGLVDSNCVREGYEPYGF